MNVTRTNKPIVRLVLGIGVIGAGVIAAGMIGSGDARAQAPSTDAPRTGWPTNGGDYGNRRYSPLTRIDRSNVAELKGVWRTHLNGSGIEPKYSGETQPLVVDGVVYVSTGANDVFAVSVETGEMLWSYEAHLDAGISTICCGWVSRGVALGDGKVFQGQLDGKLVALDRDTGEVVWSVQAERWQDGLTITSAPLFYDGLVVTGFAGAEFGIRGRVKAFDADDGSLVWTFYTIPAPGEIGSDTWPDNDLWQHGGGTVWQTPAVDPNLGLIYFSTGNPGPDFNGAVRRGDNLFTSSIVAVDARTGAYRWHFQQVHHDIWDYDSPAPVVLFDIELDGRMRRALVQTSKTGWAYILDRTNGEPLIGIEERPVPQEPRQATSPTQPIPRGDAFVPQSLEVAPEGFTLVNDGRTFTPFWTDPVIAKPGINGGSNWPPSSYDPRTGLLYVCASDDATVFRAFETSEERPPVGEFYIGGEFGTNPMPRFGIFAALDMRTNELAWQQHWPEACYSGSAATAGGLVFVGRNDGRLTALDSSNGKLLWEFQTDAGVNAPPSVFAHDGRQYVAVLAAGNLFAGSTHGDSLWLFGLEGEIEPLGLAPEAMSSIASGAADLANGAVVFQSTCTFCHGATGEGGHGGPPLPRDVSIDRVRETVTGGRNMMPAFGAMLSPEQLRDVIAHVAELIAD